MSDGAARAAGRAAGPLVAAATLPVARVVVDVPLAHLDRPFDYLVPEAMAADAVPGCRVRVWFAGRQVDGFVLDRVERSEHSDQGGRLQFLTRVVSPEPVLTPEIAALARAVADRCAGRLIDVVRLAVPRRHGRTEDESPPVPAPPPLRPTADGWGAYPRGGAFLDAVAAGRPAHAVWQAAPGEDWPTRLAEVAVTAAAAGRGVVIVVPDHRDVDRVHRACDAVLTAHAAPTTAAAETTADTTAAAAAGAIADLDADTDGLDSGAAARPVGDTVVALTADLGPSRRYRRWLAALRGSARIVVGTRAAMFAPVRDPGLLVVWDDGDDLHAEPRAPYPHAREVLAQRAHASGAALLCAGFARTAEAQLLVETGWAHEITAPRDAVRAAAPRVAAVSDDEWEQARDAAARSARLPLLAVDAARAALEAGRPVLVQVPRAGYVPSLACGTCRTPARCRRCTGPLALPAGRTDAATTGAATTAAASTAAATTAADRRAAAAVARPPACRWCGVTEAAYGCPACGSRRLRAVVVGAARTAEELGRAFPGVPVRTSGGDAVLATVPGRRALVVCTPGAEPVADGGFGAALLLDGWALLARPDLRAAEEAVRRWLAAAALVRSAADGGRVVVVADSTVPAVQAVVRWDPVWHAAAELAARVEVGFPPAVRVAAIDGTPLAVAELLDAARLPATASQLGPVPLSDGQERMLVRAPRSDGRALSSALAAAQAVRSARKATDPVRVRVDPIELG